MEGWPNEGGVRCRPVLGGKIESEQPSQQVMHIADILPTLADLIGFDAGDIDGKRFQPWLKEI